MVSRGLERERHVATRRRKELVGFLAALVVRREEASGGKGASLGGMEAAEAALRACRRRCGGSTLTDEDVVVVFVGVVAAEEDFLPFLEMTHSRQLEGSRIRFDRKYVALPPEKFAELLRRGADVAEERHRLLATRVMFVWKLY